MGIIDAKTIILPAPDYYPTAHKICTLAAVEIGHAEGVLVEDLLIKAVKRGEVQSNVRSLVRVLKQGVGMLTAIKAVTTKTAYVERIVEACSTQSACVRADQEVNK